VLDHLGSTNTYLREFLSHKQKSNSEEQAYISLFQCGRAECQLVTVHSADCYLGPIPTTPLPNKPSVFDRLSTPTSEESKSWRKRKAGNLTSSQCLSTWQVEEKIWHDIEEGDKGFVYPQSVLQTLTITQT